MPIDLRAEAEKKKYKIYSLEDCEPKMFEGFHRGKVKGSTTYIPDIDKCWTWRMQEFNLWTGYHNEGKSLFIRYLSLIKAIMDGWIFLFAAPEDFPPEEFYDDLIHTFVGMSTDKDNPSQMSEDWYIRAAAVIKQYIYFVYTDPGCTVQQVLNSFDEIMQGFENQGLKVKVCVIDPLIKFARPKDFMERDDMYAQHITTICTDFCRRKDISLHLVMHQLTPRLTDTGLYPKPSAYTIKGGGTWSDGSDNVLIIWRPNYAKEKTDNEVMFGSPKIKKQKLVGIPQEVLFRFNRRSNRYVTHTGDHDLFNLDELFQQRALR